MLVPTPLGVRNYGKMGRAKLVRGKDTAGVGTHANKDGTHPWLVSIPMGVREDCKRGRAKLVRGKNSPWVGTHTNKNWNHLWLDMAFANPVVCENG